MLLAVAMLAITPFAHAATTIVTNEAQLASGSDAHVVNTYSIGAGGLTLSSGDTLSLGGYVANSGTPNNVPVALSGGALVIEDGGTLDLQKAWKNSRPAQGSVQYNTNVLTLNSGGVINFGVDSTVAERGDESGGFGAVTGDFRLLVNGNLALNGGSLISNVSSPQLWLKGTNNTIKSGVSIASNMGIVMNSGTQTLKSDIALNSVLLRLGGAQTVTLGADTHSSLTINTLKFHQQNANSSTTLKLGSNLALTNYFSLAAQPNNYALNIDTNGYTLDMTAPNTRFEFSTSSATVLDFTGAGQVVAHSYKFDYSSNVSVNIGAGTTLIARKGNVTNTLSASGRGSVDATSVFIFDYESQEGDANDNCFLVSPQGIGKVIARKGTIYASSDLDIRGGVVIEAGAAFDAATRTVTTPSYTFGLNGAEYGKISASSAVSIAGKTLTFDFAASPTSDASYSFFTTGITGSAGSVSVTFAGLNAFALTNNNGVWSFIQDGYTYTFTESSGILSVASAIPEPSTVALITGIGAVLFVLIRQRKS